MLLKGKEFFTDPKVIEMATYRREVVMNAFVEARVLEKVISEEVRQIGNLTGEIELAA